MTAPTEGEAGNYAADDALVVQEPRRVRSLADTLNVERASCPTCGVDPPFRCTTTSGRSTKPHRTRVEVYLARRTASASGSS